MIPRVAVVEDEEALSVLLRYNLEAEGFEVDTILRGDEAEMRLQERTPDLLILDWMLPGVSGIELCRRLRMRPETERLPIIMLTARGEESERVRGLSTGADDYVVKPFSTPELVARVKAMLRRARPEVLSTVLKCGDIELDRETHRVHRKTREVRLGPTEFRLLEFLMSSPGRVFSRSQLLDGVWGHALEGDLDYLIVDLPPGTGDIQLTLAQKIPVAGAVIVTTPQDVATLDARKALKMFEKVNVPVLGLVENMAVHVCSNCGHAEHIFGDGGGKRMAEQYGVPLLGSLPLEIAIREQGDAGSPVVAAAPASAAAAAYRATALRMAIELARRPRVATPLSASLV